MGGQKLSTIGPTFNHFDTIP